MAQTRIRAIVTQWLIMGLRSPPAGWSSGSADETVAALVEAMARAGAFALPGGRADAAVALILPPGLYTMVRRAVIPAQHDGCRDVTTPRDHWAGTSRSSDEPDNKPRRATLM